MDLGNLNHEGRHAVEEEEEIQKLERHENIEKLDDAYQY